MEKVKTIGDLSIINSRTCRILDEHLKIIGTGWFCSSDGYILTAGHVITNNQEKTIEQSENVIVDINWEEKFYKAAVVFCQYKESNYADFALLKVDINKKVGFLKIDTSIDIAHLNTYSKVYICGYGEQNKISLTSDIGTLISQHNENENSTLKIRCQDAVQRGISGGGVYSFDTESVIGIQIKATNNDTGANKDNVLVMPMGRILIALKNEIPEIAEIIIAEHTKSVSIPSDPYFRAIQTYHDQNSKVKNMFKIEDALQGKSKPFNTLLSVDEGKPVSFDKAITEIEENKHNMVIFGAGGAGKTFMLLRETAKMKNTPFDSKDFRYFVFIPLNSLDLTTESPIKSYIKEKIFLDLPYMDDFFKRYESNNLLILFDGFNELPIEKRDIVADEINDLPDKINCTIVISSRYEDTLANNIQYDKTAVICELDSQEITQYLASCYYSGNLPVDYQLEKILKNPLMLTLFGNTARYQRDKNYLGRKKLCRWIRTESNVNESQILWNYLCCDIMKCDSIQKEENYNKEVFINWLTVRFIFPRIAYFMQSKNVEHPFHITKIQLKEQVKKTVEWIHANRKHAEIQYAVKIAGDEFNFKEIEQFLDSINESQIEEFVLKKQIKIKDDPSENENTTLLKFDHQSLRDVLAAVHLLNMAIIQDIQFSKE